MSQPAFHILYCEHCNTPLTLGGGPTGAYVSGECGVFCRECGSGKNNNCHLCKKGPESGYVPHPDDDIDFNFDGQLERYLKRTYQASTGYTKEQLDDGIGSVADLEIASETESALGKEYRPHP